jgi:DNA topoisomerase-1
MDGALQRKSMRPRDSGAFPLLAPALRAGTSGASKSRANGSSAVRQPVHARAKARSVTSLDYSTDTEPGITRDQSDEGFAYRSARGRLIRGRQTLERIRRLAIPPAWRDVWICANPNGHLQATGKDARGRKQYRYHAVWVAERDANKFDALHDFALALPRIRRRIAQDLATPALTKERVLAAVVQLMDRTFIRVGGERYRRDNGSFGATTLRNRHVQVAGEEIVFDFRGKSGKRHRIAIQDRRVASVIRRCLEYPGQLFVYRNGDDVKSISATDVNEYLAKTGGQPVTSKDFRTWGGTVAAAEFLSALPKENEDNGASARGVAKRHVRDAIRSVSRVLGNTPAVCRRSYIHPAVFRCYEAGVVAEPKPIAGLRAKECAALSLLSATA